MFDLERLTGQTWVLLQWEVLANVNQLKKIKKEEEIAKEGNVKSHLFCFQGKYT